MSGPVILSPEQRRIRAAAEERLRLVQDQFRKAEAVKRGMEKTEDIQKLLASMAEDRKAAEISRELSEIYRRCRTALDRWKTIENTVDREVLRQYNAELDRLTKTVRPRMETLEREARRRRDAFVKEKLKAIPAAITALKETEGRQITVFAAPDIPAEMVNVERDRLMDLIAKAESRAKRIHALKDRNFDDIREEIRSALGRGKRENHMIFQDLHQTDVMTIQPLLRSLEAAEADWDRLDQELSGELAAYHAVCAEYGITPRAFAFRSSSVQEIRYETAEILHRCAQAANCAEIMARVREILGSMGYTYMGEKEEDRRVLRQIYRIHDRTILHVIFDSTGRVTMEVAIAGDEDRTPSERETEQIVSDQGTFCGSFGKLLEQLNSSGMHMKQDILCPGGAEYAQVISTAGFTRAEEAQTEFDYSIYETPENKYLEMR